MVTITPPLLEVLQGGKTDLVDMTTLYSRSESLDHWDSDLFYLWNWDSELFYFCPSCGANSWLPQVSSLTLELIDFSVHWLFSASFHIQLTHCSCLIFYIWVTESTFFPVCRAEGRKMERNRQKLNLKGRVGREECPHLVDGTTKGHGEVKGRLGRSFSSSKLKLSYPEGQREISIF